ncbi:MAG: ABC transporter ATP-binding protein [Anaerolineales bacterium]|nr:ABC transporter ATP-binding protein [Anaerolineales bacterium]MCL4259282.1 ABC transporter ATP-binding protein [Anaerolineales bacterium]
MTEIKQGDIVLQARGITKRYPGLVANDHIDFEIRAGEIHAILGENGAGKTTLMSILFGLTHPDEGEIYVFGKKVNFRSPLDAIDLGIGMVHQARKLISAHTVLENILLGHPHAGAILDMKKTAEEVKQLCDAYGYKIDLNAKVWHLSEGEKQMVEILKALYRGAKILIMDEPTSALAPPETEKLLETIQLMTKNELAIVPFITHKLPIVLSVSQRVTVLRRGKIVARLNTAEATEQSLAMEMIGREVLFNLKRPDVKIGKPILQVENISVHDDKDYWAARNISFEVREGEIFGIAGVSGNGQQPLAEALAGLRKASAGRVLFENKDITRLSSLERWKKGIGYIPSEQRAVGSIGDFSLVENLLMSYYYDDQFVKWGLIDAKKIRQLTQELIEEYNVATPNPDVKARNLSGGNLQKMILARVFSRKPRLIIANLPTQGLDVGAMEFVQNKLLEEKKAGAGILLISEDLDEIMALSDRIAPMYEGEFMDILPGGSAQRETVGALMAGHKQKAVQA